MDEVAIWVGYGLIIAVSGVFTVSALYWFFGGINAAWRFEDREHKLVSKDDVKNLKDDTTYALNRCTELAEEIEKLRTQKTKAIKPTTRRRK